MDSFRNEKLLKIDQFQQKISQHRIIRFQNFYFMKVDLDPPPQNFFSWKICEIPQKSYNYTFVKEIFCKKWKFDLTEKNSEWSRFWLLFHTVRGRVNIHCSNLHSMLSASNQSNLCYFAPKITLPCNNKSFKKTSYSYRWHTPNSLKWI